MIILQNVMKSEINKEDNMAFNAQLPVNMGLYLHTLNYYSNLNLLGPLKVLN